VLHVYMLVAVRELTD